MANTSAVEEERETTNNTNNATNSPIVGEGESNNGNTVYVHVGPSGFRAVVQKLTGAPLSLSSTPATATPISSLPSAKRPKLQERRQGMAPARLDILFPTHLQFLAQIQKPVPDSDFFFSPVSTMDHAAFLVSNSPLPSELSPTNSFVGIDGPTVVLTKEEEEREEKMIAQKGFYLHHSPSSRGAANGAKPKLLPLFPILSPN